MRADATLRIRPARVEDAAVLCVAERETACVPGHLVSLPQELDEGAFARKITTEPTAAVRTGTTGGNRPNSGPWPAR